MFSMKYFLPECSYELEIEQVLHNWFSIPDRPAVYVFVGVEDEVLYCGKTAHLRTRLRTHCSDAGHNKYLSRSIHTGEVKKVKVFECITELDAIVLERYFIQSGIYCGKYNIQYAKNQHIKNGYSENNFNEIDPNFEEGSIEYAFYKLNEEILYAYHQTNRKVTRDFGQCAKTAFRNCVLRIMKKLKEAVIIWNVHFEDNKHLLHQDTCDVLERYIIRSKKNRKILKEEYNIELSGNIRVKVTYCPFYEELFKHKELPCWDEFRKFRTEYFNKLTI